MSTTTTVRPSSAAHSMARPLPTPNAPSSTIDSPAISSSPTTTSKPAPTPGLNSKPLANLNSVNGNLPRTRPRPKASHAKPQDKGPMNGEHVDLKPKEPYVKDDKFILRKFRGKSPSLILHLHPTYFRFDQQDGTFSYNSEMRIIIEHLKARTVPHDLIEELLQSNVAFYDGCLIVEVHDHKTIATGNKDVASSGDDLRGVKPFSLHDNGNPFITPSPYAPYPNDRASGSRPSSSKENINEVSGNMPAPEKPAKKVKKPRIFTVVLHPTDLVRHREISLLTRTPMVDQKGNSRRQSSISGRERPAPLSTIPPTPTSATTSYVSKGAKRQRMCLEEGDIHQFEAEVLQAQNPNLLLDPVNDIYESQALMDQLRDPLHDQQPIKKKTRKRTTAELAADKTAAAEEERIALLMDDRRQASLSTGDGKLADFQPDFALFKKLEDIKQSHEEAERKRKADEAARNASGKQHSEEEKRRQTAEQAARQESQLRQRGALQQQQRSRQMQQQQHPTQMQSPVHPALVQQMIQQNIQGPHMSPIAGSLAPANPSPIASGNTFSGPMPGTQMVATSSSQGPGSPPRVSSAMPAPAGMAPPMARQASQQTSQPNLSRNSTPQIGHATPQMRNMTPQPQPNQMTNGMQHTPVMGPQQMHTPQMSRPQTNMQQMGQQLQAQMMAARQTGDTRQVANIQHLMQQMQKQQEMLRRQHQVPMGQNPQMAMQASPQANQFGGQMSPQQNGVPHTPSAPPMQGNMSNDAMEQARKMQQYRFTIAQAARNKLPPQANGQGSPQGPPQTVGQQYGGQMSSAGSPNGINMAPAMHRNPSQLNGMQGAAQGPHQQQGINQVGMGGQQGRPQNPNQQAQLQRFRQDYLQNLTAQNGGEQPPDAEQKFSAYMRQRHMHAIHKNAQQLAGQAGGGVMMPGQGLQAMQQGGVRHPGQMQNMQNMQGMSQFQQPQQQAAMLKAQQERQIALRQQQQQQQQQNMMNGMANGMMPNGMPNGMNGGMNGR